ncbi:MAG: symmetrical bis(5'-nucleosyl)-tetraphosphatase [Nitrospira sp.]|nr:symmetrical bis(5'-nucleosyl)-tetraphosphatase [Nitrospira sp.]
MATYAIGDIQGCFRSLRALLDKVAFHPPADRLWLVGDLVNRGPHSLEVLRYLRDLGSSAQIVLGNHDLFLLAVAEGVLPLRPQDTIGEILAAPDRASLLSWLRHRPLHHREGPYLMVHAGLLPQWTVEEAIGYAQEVETVLTGPDYRTFLHHLFHGPPRPWSDNLHGWERLTAIARVLTKLRTCTSTGVMSNFSGPPDEAPGGFAPWFQLPHHRDQGLTLITGHWAALGLRLTQDHIALDTGCVWGKHLTAVRLEDRSIFQVACILNEGSRSIEGDSSRQPLNV